MVPEQFRHELLPLLAPRLAHLLELAVTRLSSPLEEIRIRQGRPLHLVCQDRDHFVTAGGLLTSDPCEALLPSADDLHRTFQLMAQGSVYAWEEEVRGGFLTLPGGHRVGLCGRAVVESGRIQTLKEIASLNVRVAREVRGAADGLLPRILRGGLPLSTLILSPPQAGKTTILRDLVRQLSTGATRLGLPGLKVALVDERSEVAGCHLGVPQRDVGPRTDVLDGCPKAEGMMLLIRALSPHVVAVDEIGRREDAAAVMEALHAGVTVVATAHGDDLARVARRPALGELLKAGAFRRVAILSRSRGPGTVERVIDLDREVVVA